MRQGGGFFFFCTVRWLFAKDLHRILGTAAAIVWPVKHNWDGMDRGFIPTTNEVMIHVMHALDALCVFACERKAGFEWAKTLWRHAGEHAGGDTNFDISRPWLDEGLQGLWESFFHRRGSMGATTSLRVTAGKSGDLTA